MYINIDNGSLRYGALLGFKLSRLEWIWGSNMEIAKENFESSKADILYQLPLGSMQIDELNYKTFSQSILGYYLRTDIDVYSAILIGMTIQRCSLIGSSKDPKSNLEIELLAKSTLVSISKKVISNKDELFCVILKHKNEDIFEILDVLEDFCTKSVEDDLSINILEKKPTLFLSYCQKDSCIANIIESQLCLETNNGIRISRYNRLPYKESFKLFMNSIQEHDFVLCIVSDSYLKSQACMYEVGEIVKNQNYVDKLLFVVLGEEDRKYYTDDSSDLVAARVYGSETNRLVYVRYWKKEYEELKKKIDEIDDPEAITRSSQKLKEIGRIYRNDISEFLTYLAENNGKNFDELYLNNFIDILNWIFPKWESKMFIKCTNYTELFAKAIQEIWDVTGTDYNQIVLSSKISSHENGLVVYADNISEKKQRYRLVIMEGIIGRAFATGNIINVKDAEKEKNYFCAVENTKSELVVPIQFQGNVIGVINSESEKKDYYSELIKNRICNIANNLSIALNRLGYISTISFNEIPYIHIEF